MISMNKGTGGYKGRATAQFHQFINSEELLGSTVNTSVVVKQQRNSVEIASSLHIKKPSSVSALVPVSREDTISETRSSTRTSFMLVTIGCGCVELEI
jgi:hypothetical protein